MSERSRSGNEVDPPPIEAGETATPVPTQRRRRRTVIALLVAVGALLLAAGGGLILSGGTDALFGAADEETAAAEARARIVFYPLPDLVISLDAGDKRAAFLKLRVTLELPERSDPAQIERMLPRIIDYCQIYLRDLSVDDLRGSAGSLRVREELLRRIRIAVAPATVNDVLFADMLIH